MRVLTSHNCSPWVRWMLGLAVLVNQGPMGVAIAQATLSPQPSTTMIIVAHRRMVDCQWTAVFDAQQGNRTDAAAESHAISNAAHIVLDDHVQPGMGEDTAVVVHLHGDCSLRSLPGRVTYNALVGWVRLDDGRIEPFAQIDCTRRGRALGAATTDLVPDARNQMRVGSMARVILHEWIRFAGRSGTRADQGLFRAHFGFMDLLTGAGHPIARIHRLW